MMSSDLWTLAGVDAEAERDHRYLTGARQAAVQAWAFLAGAESRGDFENRRALVGEQLDAAAARAVGQDTGSFIVVRAALEDSFLEDFEAIHAERQAESQRRNAHRAALRRQEAEARKRVEAQAKRAALAPKTADYYRVKIRVSPEQRTEIDRTIVEAGGYVTSTAFGFEVSREDIDLLRGTISAVTGEEPPAGEWIKIEAQSRRRDKTANAEQDACEKCQARPGYHADLHAGHIWTNVSCPAYRSMDGADCTCGGNPDHFPSSPNYRPASRRTAIEETWATHEVSTAFIWNEQSVYFQLASVNTVEDLKALIQPLMDASPYWDSADDDKVDWDALLAEVLADEWVGEGGEGRTGARKVAWGPGNIPQPGDVIEGPFGPGSYTILVTEVTDHHPDGDVFVDGIRSDYPTGDPGVDQAEGYVSFLWSYDQIPPRVGSRRTAAMYRVGDSIVLPEGLGTALDGQRVYISNSNESNQIAVVQARPDGHAVDSQMGSGFWIHRDDIAAMGGPGEVIHDVWGSGTTGRRRTAAKPSSRRAGEGAYATAAHDSSIRHEIAPGTIANPTQGYVTWTGAKVYDWHIDGLGDGLQLGGSWTEVDGSSATGSRRTAADHIECERCALHGVFYCQETVGTCDLCHQEYDVFRYRPEGEVPETVCLNCLVNGEHMKSAHTDDWQDPRTAAHRTAALYTFTVNGRDYEWDYEYDEDYANVEREAAVVILVRDADTEEVVDAVGGFTLESLDISDHGNVNISREDQEWLRERAIEMVSSRRTAIQNERTVEVMTSSDAERVSAIAKEHGLSARVTSREATGGDLHFVHVQFPQGNLPDLLAAQQAFQRDIAGFTYFGARREAVDLPPLGFDSYQFKRAGQGEWQDGGATFQGALEAAKALIDRAQSSTIMLIRNGFNGSVTVVEIDALGNTNSVQSYEQFYGHPYTAGRRAKVAGYIRGVDCPGSEHAWVTPGDVTGGVATCSECGQSVPTTGEAHTFYDDDGEPYEVQYLMVHLLPGKTIDDRISAESGHQAKVALAWSESRPWVQTYAGLKERVNMWEANQGDFVLSVVQAPYPGPDPFLWSVTGALSDREMAKGQAPTLSVAQEAAVAASRNVAGQMVMGQRRTADNGWSPPIGEGPRTKTISSPDRRFMADLSFNYREGSQGVFDWEARFYPYPPGQDQPVVTGQAISPGEAMRQAEQAAQDYFQRTASRRTAAHGDPYYNDADIEMAHLNSGYYDEDVCPKCGAIDSFVSRFQRPEEEAVVQAVADRNGVKRNEVTTCHACRTSFLNRKGLPVLARRTAGYGPVDPDGTPFGAWGDHCPFCANDWKQPCDPDCLRREQPEQARRMEDEAQRYYNSQRASARRAAGERNS
jgi:hypothetical protein